jgi:hypothetical protein
MIAAPEVKPLRQANPRDWIITPEVRFGPSHHSLAPPALA